MLRILLLLLTLLLLTLVGPGANADEPGGGEQVRAPDQHRHSLFITAHPSLFTSPNVDEVFEKDTFPEPEFLPPEAYEDGPGPTFQEEGQPSPLQLVQYPMEDSAARDDDPEGHYAEPRWNPFPFLSAPSACTPDERGLIWKERSVTTTTLPGTYGNLGITTFDFRTVAYLGQFPILQVAPRFGWHLLGGPDTTDVPPQLYDTGVDTSLFLPLGSRWSFWGMVGPSLFTDGQNLTSQAFRMTGRALLFYQLSETTKLSAGFLYLGRADVKALPAGGVIYKPNDRLKAELLFPKPKVAYRLSLNGGIERWCYLAGEFGGNTWAVERTSGADDLLTYRDYRLIAGFEHVQQDAWRWLLEAGFVFGRKISYTSGLGDVTLSPTGLIRCGIVF